MSGTCKSAFITGAEALTCLLLISWIHWLLYKSFPLCPETIFKNPFSYGCSANYIYDMPAFPCRDRSLTFTWRKVNIWVKKSSLFFLSEFPLSLAVRCGETGTLTETRKLQAVELVLKVATG